MTLPGAQYELGQFPSFEFFEGTNWACLVDGDLKA